MYAIANLEINGSLVQCLVKVCQKRLTDNHLTLTDTCRNCWAKCDVIMYCTLKAVVYCSWKDVSQDHHSRVNYDFSASAVRPRDLPLPSPTVQLKQHLIVMPIQKDLMPFAVVKTVGGQSEVVVPVTKVVENSQKSLEDLQRHEDLTRHSITLASVSKYLPPLLTKYFKIWLLCTLFHNNLKICFLTCYCTVALGCHSC